MQTEGASTPATPPGSVDLDAHLAYGMCAYVDGMPSALPDGWDVVWVPTKPNDLNGNYAVVLQAQNRQPALFALAIQGTQDIWDVMEDLEIVPQPPFPPIAGACISLGSQKGLDDLLTLDGTYQGKTVSLLSLLQSFSTGTSLLVTGHSLGGNLASVITPWIAVNVPAFGPNEEPLRGLPENLTAITFAAPTAGNAAFAEFLDRHPARYRAHFNRNDVVSNVWAESGPLQLANIHALFPPPGPNPAPRFVREVLAFKIHQMRHAQPPVSYTQTKGTIFDFPPGEPPQPMSPDDAWLWELAYQHNYAYCAQFLGPDAGCKA